MLGIKPWSSTSAPNHWALSSVHETLIKKSESFKLCCSKTYIFFLNMSFCGISRKPYSTWAWIQIGCKVNCFFLFLFTLIVIVHVEKHGCGGWEVFHLLFLFHHYVGPEAEQRWSGHTVRASTHRAFLIPLVQIYF